MKQYTHPDLIHFISPAPFKLGEGDETISYARGWWEKATEQEIAVLGFVEYVPSEPEPAPEPPLPPLTARQLRLGLIGAGVSIASVDAAIASIEDPTDREIANVEWEYASQFERGHHLIEMIGSALGMTIEQINAAWIAAMEL